MGRRPVQSLSAWTRVHFTFFTLRFLQFQMQGKNPCLDRAQSRLDAVDKRRKRPWKDTDTDPRLYIP